MEPEVIKCYQRDQTEIASFLTLLSASEGSTAALTELARCNAVWEYIMECSKEQYDTTMAMQILSIVDKICSGAQRNMSHTVIHLVKKFQQSAFFKTFFPDFINEMTEDVSLVQRILEYVITAFPAAGPHVLPMAKALMYKLVDNSTNLETAIENGRAAIDFLTKLSSSIASEVPHGHDNVKDLQWNDLPLIPVVKEIHEPSLKTDDLPVIKEEGPYSSEEEYLNTYFRLLREECFYKLRKGIYDFVTNGSKCSSKDMTMYRVFLRGASLDHENSPSMMLLSLQYEKSESSENSNEQLDQDPLMYGDLLCISLDGSFEKPIWGLVEGHISNQRIVRITLCDKANDLSEAEFITQMQEVTNKNDGAYMAQSQTFYPAFASAMEVLQRKEHVPFKEFLVYPKSNYMEPPEYLTDIKSPPDWEIIFHKESLSCQEEESPYSPLKDLERMRMNSNFKPKLDPTQLAAVELALKNKLVLIQGPPGTGKSFVGVRLVRLLLSMKVPQSHGPILVVTYKNHALNNFLEALAKDSSPDEKIIRVGNLPEDADEKLKKLLLREVGRNWPQGLFDRKRTLTGKLWALQPRLRSAYQKLAFSSIFNAEMFLEEASVDQIRSLLKDNKRESVHGKELETLLKKVMKDGDRGGVKNNARLSELVENALQHWLPAQEEFDKFVSNKQEPKPKRNVAAALAKQRSKEDPEQENPSDTRDPSVEEKERLLALDKEICDEEDEQIARDVVNEHQENGDPYCETRERKLVCVDKTMVEPHRKLLDSVKVWDLKKEERVQLVYVLQSEFYRKASDDFLEKSSWYTEIHQQLKELRNQHDIDVMKKCHVIGMTVTGATIRANLFADIKPSVMIVEEAAEILEAQLVAVIPPSVQHLVMIGDHKQLRPTVHFNRLKRHNLHISLFERLINCKLPHRQLEFQCRMKDEIVDLLQELKIYDNLKTQHELVKKNVLPSCVESSMYFWNHTEWENESKNSHSKRNTREAIEITKVAKKFCERGRVPPSKITVLCSYRGQVDEIKKHFKQADEFATLSDIKVTTIDSFQGQENDIILISLVRSNRKGEIGYLSSMNRLCVAISRARCGLYLFGNQTHLAKASKKGWKVIGEFMRRNKALGTKFPFSSSDNGRGDGYHGSPPTRDENRGGINIYAQQVFVAVGDGSVNTMNVGRENSPSGTTTSRRLEMPLSTSRKTPVQDPKSPSPSPGFSPPRVERSDTGANSSDVPLHGNERDGSVVVDVRPNEITGVESEKDARMPIQEAPAADDAFLDLNDMENMKERPEQESGTPGKSAGDSPVAVDESLPSDKDARRPMQETPEAQKSPESVEFENIKERPLQESKNPSSDSSVKGDNDLPSGKEARRPTQESPEAEKSSPGSIKEESMKEKPIQELADEKRSEETAVQESDETSKKDELRDHPVRHVYQEADLKEQMKETLAQETINQSGVETDNQSLDDPVQETQGLGKVKEEDEDLRPFKDDYCAEASTRCETETKEQIDEASQVTTQPASGFQDDQSSYSSSSRPDNVTTKEEKYGETDEIYEDTEDLYDDVQSVLPRNEAEDSKDTMASKVVTGKGASLSVKGVNMICPPGAVEDPVSIRLTLEEPYRYCYLTARCGLLNDVLFVAPIVNCLPNGQKFEKCVTLKVTLNSKRVKSGGDLLVLHGTRTGQSQIINWEDVTNESRFDLQTKKLEVRISQFSLIAVLARLTLVRTKEIVSRLNLIPFNYILSVLLKINWQQSPFAELALVFMSQDTYQEEYYRDHDDSAIMRLKKDGFEELLIDSKNAQDSTCIYNKEIIRISIQLGEDYKPANNQQECLKLVVDSTAWWNTGHVIKLPLQVCKTNSKIVCGKILVRGEYGHVRENKFCQQDLCGYVRHVLGVNQRAIFDVKAVAQKLELPAETQRQVVTCWQSEAKQLELVILHWREKHGDAANLNHLKKALEELEPAEYKVKERGQMHIVHLRKLAFKIAGLQHQDSDVMKYFDREVEKLCCAVLRDCCIENATSKEEVESAVQTENFASVLVMKKRLPESVGKTCARMFSSREDEFNTSSFLCIVSELIQAIKEIFREEKIQRTPSGLRGVTEDATLQKITSGIRDAARDKSIFKLLSEVCNILEILCRNNNDDRQKESQIQSWGSCAMMAVMLHFLERFFQCTEACRLYRRLKLFSLSMRDIMSNPTAYEGSFPSDFHNVAVSLLKFAKFDPSNLVQFELKDPNNSINNQTKDDIKYDRSKEMFSQLFWMIKKCEENLKLEATARVHIGGQLLTLGAFEAMIILPESYSEVVENAPIASFPVSFKSETDRESSNLRVTLYSTQKDNIRKALEYLQNELDGQSSLSKQTEIKETSLKLLNVAKAGTDVRLRLTHRWGSGTIGVESNTFVPLGYSSPETQSNLEITGEPGQQAVGESSLLPAAGTSEYIVDNHNRGKNFMTGLSGTELIPSSTSKTRPTVINVNNFIHHTVNMEGHVCVAGENPNLNVQATSSVAQRFLEAGPGAATNRSITAGAIEGSE